MDIKQLMLNVELMSIIKTGDLVQVTNLIDAGANVNFINLYNNNETPLHEAVSTGNPQVVKLLLNKGANRAVENNNNKKPIDLIFTLGDLDKQVIEQVFKEHFNAIELEKTDQQMGSVSCSDIENDSTGIENHPQSQKSDACMSNTSSSEGHPELLAKTYIKRPGTTTVGQFYEIKLLAMVLFRLLHDDQIESFDLANNLDEAGAFDDIVLRAVVGEQTRVQCLQAKHKKETKEINFEEMISTKSSGGDFHLSKYYDSFLKIRSMFTADSNHPIFYGEYAKVKLELIIFTPAIIVYPKEVKIVNISSCKNILSKQSGKVVQIELAESFLTSLELWHRNVIAEIVANLILLQDYNTSDLKEAIDRLEQDIVLKQVLNANGKINSSDLLKLYCNQHVMKFSKRKTEGLSKRIVTFLKAPFLPSHDEMVSIAKDFFDKLIIYSEQALEDELGTIVKLDLKARNYENENSIFSKAYSAVENWWKQNGEVYFQNKTCKFFKNAVNEVNIEKLHSISVNHIWSDCVTFYENRPFHPTASIILKEINEDKRCCTNIFSKTPELCCLKIVQYFKAHANGFQFIIIENVERAQTIEHFSKVKPQCLIIAYISIDDDKIIRHLCQSVNKLIFITRQKHYYQGRIIEDEMNNLLDLTTESQEKLLDTVVTFQGSELPLRTLMDRAPRTMIDSSTLEKFVKKERIFISHTFLSEDLDTSIEYIDRLLMNNRRKQPITKSINKIYDKIVIIAAEAGMGKSTLLTGLASAIHETNKSIWIVRINLLNFAKTFHYWNEKNISLANDHAIDMMIDAMCSEKSNPFSKQDSFERKIFQWYCEQSKIYLLIDGFDEISPDYTDIALQLLQIYKRTFTARIWVSTRTGEIQTELEKCLEINAYILKPFTLEETIKFIRNFWKGNTKITQHQHTLCEDFAKLLLSHLAQTTDEGEHDLIRVPLQIKMIATIFENDFITYCRTNGKQFKLKKVDLVSLYETCINIKYKSILTEEKNKIDSTKPHNRKQIEENFKYFQNNHKQAAIWALFTQVDIEKLLSKEQIESVQRFANNIKESIEKTGIITRIADGKPIFIHQTYAEFFAVSYLWEKYTLLQDEEFEAFVKSILIGSLVKDERTQTAKMLQEIVQKNIKNCSNDALKTCVLLENLLDVSLDSWQEFSSKTYSYLLGIVERSMNIDSECLTKLEILVKTKSDHTRNMLLLKASESGHVGLVRLVIEDNSDRINATFDWLEGWTVLHFAADNGHTNIVEYLVCKSSKIKNVTTRSAQSALHLAVEKGHHSIVQLLLDNGADVATSMKDIGLTPLHSAAREGSTETVSMLLLDDTIDINSVTSIEGETALHIASSNGNQRIVEILIEKGADVNIRTKTDGSIPLHVATKSNYPTIVRTLLENDSNINAKTKDLGFTALHLACQKDFFQVAYMLIDDGADVNCESINGKTPLQLALSYGHKEIIKLLLKNGACTDYTGVQK